MAGDVEDRFRLVGATLEGKFRVDALVAEGGFGVVYRALHLGLDVPVALKVLKTPEEFRGARRDAFVDKFVAEARTIARVRHPAIVQVLDTGVATMPSGERAPWIVLEWLTGETLEDALLRRRGQGGRSPSYAMTLLRPIFDALAHAHGQGIAHRDIKPANVMLVPGRREATARLLDFGIAKAMDPTAEAGTGSTRTTSAFQAYSPLYASPEQVGSARTGPWTDVHALGLMLTEILTDQAPIAATDPIAVVAGVLDRERPTPQKFGVHVGAWEPVLARALAIRPDERFADAGAFAEALEGALAAATHDVAVAPTVALADAARPGGGTTLQGAAGSSALLPRRHGSWWIVGATALAVAAVGAGVIGLSMRRPSIPSIPRRVEPAPPTPTPPSIALTPPASPTSPERHATPDASAPAAPAPIGPARSVPARAHAPLSHHRDAGRAPDGLGYEVP